ncbi:hypothetical protein GOP47_0003862 [Adiantum capillus-veneris]|uniref:Uncharacterized protein n=1 Tax=Adiantum capillus-veneris TaxID=13818 RepID=A0A9D4ZMA8_ADICA|nr:hypothetical protein GOP47_0003862 [Adiantum capillus-veneris]
MYAQLITNCSFLPTLEYHGLLDLQLADVDRERFNPLKHDKVVIHDLHRLLAESKLALPNIGHLQIANEILKNKHVSGKFDMDMVKALFGGGNGFLKIKKILRYRDPLIQVQTRWLSVDCVRSGDDINSCFPVYRSRNVHLMLNREGRNMEALRVLRLFGCVGVSCITEKLQLTYCENLKLQSLAEGGPDHEIGSGWSLIVSNCLRKLDDDQQCCWSLVNADDCVPNLQELEVKDLTHLVDVGLLSHAFRALTILILSRCDKLDPGAHPRPKIIEQVVI